ncbi:MAG: exo-alpha-sialidase [Verrucomicrobiota bacterium]
MAATGFCLFAAVASQSSQIMVESVKVQTSGGFVLATNAAVTTPTNAILFLLTDTGRGLPYTQSAIKQGANVAALGPSPRQPYFKTRFAFPIPPSNATNESAALAGVDPMVFTHNHSPGFEILPNGDALAIYFSTPPGKLEADRSTSFVQARLRYGAEDWDLPELFFKTKNYNDQSALLWNDQGRLWFLGGGRGFSDWVPFKIATSTDNGATWTFSVPLLDKPAEHYTAQPIASAFRGPDRAIYFTMDGVEASSFLWRSQDDGVHWHDMGGRTGARHSVIVPLDDQGNLLSIGGKNASVEGFSPQNTSGDWGATWSSNAPSAFPPLGTAQRPALIRLASGNLFFTTDSYLHKAGKAPPAGWNYGNDCVVALSTNNGATWHIKPLPVQLPGHQRTNHPTLGYVTAKQAPNGVIHILTTVTQPCLHYELNEAWILSNAGEIAAENSGGKVQKFSENYPNGKLRSRWSARICPNGRYLLEGKQTDYFENGKKQHEVTYAAGRKTGTETFWAADGSKRWTWSHDLKRHQSVWTQYWPNGRKKLQSTWNTLPTARDLNHTFFGLVADGPSRHWREDGRLTEEWMFINGTLQTAGKSR